MVHSNPGARLERGLACIIRSACEPLVVGLALQAVRRKIALSLTFPLSIACRQKEE